MKKIIILAQFFLIFILKGQTLINVFPPSPEASSKFNYTDFPINYYDGTSNVSIPLYEFSLDGKTFPINIFYNTKGIMVAQESSSIGLGWGINFGGQIARQIRMLPDENSTFWSTIPINLFESNVAIRENFKNYPDGLGMNWFDKMDSERDIYSYNFNGYSGKFIIDPVSHNAVMQKSEDIKIDLSQYPIQIKIIDPEGFEYYFGKDANISIGYYDTMISKSNCNIISPCEPHLEGSGYKSAWQLVSIKSPTGKYAKYEYDTEYITHYNKSDVKKLTGESAYSLTKMVEHQQTPSKITLYDGAVIKFNKKNSIREDLDGGYALDNIQVLDQNGNQIKKITLSQSYTTALDPVPNVISYYDSRSQKRLILNNVSFKDSENNFLNKYSFEYNAPLLPNRHSTSFDYWGYFNGKNNGLNIYDVTSPNKTVDINYSKAQSLKKIKYPTGGELEYFYENNLVFVPSFFNSVLIPYFNNDDNYFKKVSDGIIKGDLYYVPSSTSNIGTYEKQFTVNNGQGDITFKAVLGEGCTSIENTNCKTTVRLYLLNPPDNNTRSVFVITDGTQSFSIPDGTYKLVVSNSQFTQEDVEDYEHNAFMINFSWKELKNDIPEALVIAGGLRLQKTEKTNLSSPKEVRSYQYEKGLLHGIPDYFYIIKRTPAGIEFSGELLSAPPKPVSAYNNGKLGYAVVKEIIGDAINNKGYTSYGFTNFLDGGEYYKYTFNMPDDMEWARGLPTITKVFDSSNVIQKSIINLYQYYGKQNHPYRSFRNGLGVVQSNFNGSTYTTISDSDSEELPLLPHYYLSHHFNSIPMYKSGVNGRVVTHGEIDDPNIYKVAFFLGGSANLKSSLLTQYVNGIPTFREETNYKYPVSEHNQLTEKSTSLPDGSSIETTYQYAREKNNQKLINANMIGIPLETTVVKKQNATDTGKTISKTETKYDNPAHLFPTSVTSYDMQNTASTEVTYDKYDEKGNLQQYTTKDGIPTTIIWGYQGTQPIAKITGATYVQASAVAATIISNSNADNSTNSSTTEQALITSLNAFRKNSSLANFQVTTYTYDPLIGVTSITPPSGIREIYQYDTANRLQKIVDVNGKVLKEFKYNYKQ